MKIIVVEPFKHPEVRDIDDTLEAMQQIVGGNIQAIYPFDDLVAIIVNDEGKMLGLPPNRGLRDDNGELYDILCGTFFICGLTEDSFASLSDEQIDRFAREYETPELFLRVNEEILPLPLTPDEAEKWKRAYESQG